MRLRGGLIAVLAVVVASGAGCRKAGDRKPDLLFMGPNGWNEQSVKGFEERNPGIGVVVQASGPSDYYENVLLTALMGPKPPDVFIVSADGFGRLVELGKLLDITSLSSRDDELKASAFFPNLVAAFSDGGRLYAVPASIDPQAIYWNKTMFAAAGVAAPRDNWTWEDITKAAVRLTKRDGKGNLVQAGFDSNLRSDAWMCLGGGGVIDDEARPSRFVTDSPESLRALLLLRQFVPQDRVTQNYRLWSNDESSRKSQAMFVEGRLAMLHSQPWICDAVRRVTGRRYEWDVIRVPPAPAGRARFLGSGAGFGIRRGTRNPRLAWKLIKHFVGVEGQRRGATAGTSVPGMIAVAREWGKYHNESPINKQALVAMAEATELPQPHRARWGAATTGGPVPPIDQLLFSGGVECSATELKAAVEDYTDLSNARHFPAAFRQDWEKRLKASPPDGDRAFRMLRGMFQSCTPSKEVLPMAEAFLAAYPKSRWVPEVRDVTLSARIRDEEVKPVWMVRLNLAGPFEFDGKRKIAGNRHGPEQGRVSLAASYPGVKGARVRWTRSEAPDDGLMDLKAVFGRDYSIAYAVTYINSPRAQPAVLALEHDDGAEAWVNGRKVDSYDGLVATYGGPWVAHVALRAGANELLVKVSQSDGMWQFRAGVVADAPVQDSYTPGKEKP